MNGKQYAEHIGVPHGTVKRWLREGLPATRGTAKSQRDVVIEPQTADAWVREHKSSSVSLRRASVIYFFQREDLAIKIGWSSDVLRRAAEVRKKWRTSVTVLAVVPGDKPDELALHAKFARHLLEEEWFRPADEILSYVASLGRTAA